MEPKERHHWYALPAVILIALIAVMVVLNETHPVWRKNPPALKAYATPPPPEHAKLAPHPTATPVVDCNTNHSSDTRQVIDFLSIPEVRECEWLDLFDISLPLGNAPDRVQLASGSLFMKSIILAASEARQNTELVHEVEEKVQAAEEQWLLEGIRGLLADAVPLPSTEEMKREYEKYIDISTLPESRTCRHLFINSSSPLMATKRTQVSAERLIEKILAKLKKGEDFEALVHRYSESETAAKGGLLEKVRRDTVQSEFANELWKLDEGEISAPVFVGGGYHLIHCLLHHPTQTIPFAQVSAGIGEMLYQASQQKARQKAIDEAQKRMGAQFYPDVLKLDGKPQDVIYHINDATITLADYRRWADSLPDDLKQYYGNLENRRTFYRQEYERVLLVALARESGLDRTRAFKARHCAYLKLELAKALIKPKIESELAEISVTEEDLRFHHGEHKGRFIEPFRVELEQIHVGWNVKKGGQDPVHINTAKVKAKEVVRLLESKASRKRITRMPHVHIDWFSSKEPKTLEELPDTLKTLLQDDVVFSDLPALEAESGKIYGPVRMQDHFLVVLLGKVTPARFLGFEECQDQVEIEYRTSLTPELTFQELRSRV
jgi:PPIC-type PPIASE domain